MSFYVNKEAQSMVSPSGPVASGHRLPLSSIDRLPFMRSFVELIMVFDHGKEAAEAVRTALGRALVPYYPVAGRIVADTDGRGEVGVACTGEGVWFVKASSDCRLQDVEYLKHEPLLIPKEQLLPSSPPPQGIDELALPFMMQVTEFKCEGFVVGIKFSHAFFDGIGAGQFTVAVSEMARGLVQPTIKPIWCRDVLQSPPPTANIIPVPKEEGDDNNNNNDNNNTVMMKDEVELVFSVIDTPMSCIEQQKERYMKETGKKSTTFEVVAAKLWRSRARAIDLPPGVAVSFSSLASIRHLYFKEELGAAGYYGNCFHPVSVEAPSGQIANASLSDVVGLIREAKECLPTAYSDSLKGLGEPPLARNAYGNLAMVDWRRIGFYEADFGWGGPNHVVSLTGYRGSSGVACILNSPAPRKGVCVMIHSVAKEHHQAFLIEMNNWS